MKQMFHNKGSTVDTKGARQTTDAFENFYEFTGTGLKKFPIPDAKPLDLATELDRLSQERVQCSQAAPLKKTSVGCGEVRTASIEETATPSGAAATDAVRQLTTSYKSADGFSLTRVDLDNHRAEAESLLRHMIAL